MSYVGVGVNGSKMDEVEREVKNSHYFLVVDVDLMIESLSFVLWIVLKSFVIKYL